MGFLSSLFGIKGSQPKTSTVVQAQKLPEEISPFVKEILGEAQDLYKAEIERGYDPYTGETIAPLTAEEEAAMAGIAGLAGTTTPFLEEAVETYRTGAEKFTPEVAQEYMSPYQRAVTDIEKREAQRTFERETMPRFEASAVAAGGLSGLGTRAGVEAAEIQRGQNILLADIEARGQQKAFEDARLGFEAQKARERQMGQDVSKIGPAMLQAGLAEQGAVQTVGEQKRALGQSALDEAYYRFLEEQQFPQKTLSDYSGMVYANPMAGLTTQTDTTTGTPFVPSTGQQIMGMGLAGLNVFGMGGGFSPGGFDASKIWGNKEGGPVIGRKKGSGEGEWTWVQTETGWKPQRLLTSTGADQLDDEDDEDDEKPAKGEDAETPQGVPTMPNQLVGMPINLAPSYIPGSATVQPVTLEVENELQREAYDKRQFDRELQNMLRSRQPDRPTFGLPGSKPPPPDPIRVMTSPKQEREQDLAMQKAVMEAAARNYITQGFTAGVGSEEGIPGSFTTIDGAAVDTIGAFKYGGGLSQLANGGPVVYRQTQGPVFRGRAGMGGGRPQPMVHGYPASQALAGPPSLRGGHPSMRAAHKQQLAAYNKMQQNIMGKQKKQPSMFLGPAQPFGLSGLPLGVSPGHPSQAPVGGAGAGGGAGGDIDVTSQITDISRIVEPAVAKRALRDLSLKPFGERIDIETARIKETPGYNAKQRTKAFEDYQKTIKATQTRMNKRRKGSEEKFDKSDEELANNFYTAYEEAIKSGNNADLIAGAMDEANQRQIKAGGSSIATWLTDVLNLGTKGIGGRREKIKEDMKELLKFQYQDKKSDADKKRQRELQNINREALQESKNTIDKYGFTKELAALDRDVQQRALTMIAAKRAESTGELVAAQVWAQIVKALDDIDSSTAGKLLDKSAVPYMKQIDSRIAFSQGWFFDDETGKVMASKNTDLNKKDKAKLVDLQNQMYKEFYVNTGGLTSNASYNRAMDKISPLFNQLGTGRPQGVPSNAQQGTYQGQTIWIIDKDTAYDSTGKLIKIT